MIDIETLSTSPNAAILTIGAIKFKRNDPIKELKLYDTFYRRLDIKQMEDFAQDNMVDIDENTVKWWDKQPKEARKEAFGEEGKRHLLQDVLREFSNWFDSNSIVWAKSPAFDCIILENAYKMLDMNPPWKFWNYRDVRTIMDIGCVKNKDILNTDLHHALHDCHSQIKAVHLSLKNISKNNIINI